MELWDLYDVRRRPLGLTMARGGEQPPNTYRMVVHICVFNSEHRMLIQKRQPWKKDWPGFWDLSAGGSAVSGEDSAVAVVRECREELGFTPTLESPAPSLSEGFPGGYDDYYIVHRDISIDELHLQESEVAEARWVSKEELFAGIRDSSFIPYEPAFISLLFRLSETGRICGKESK